MELSLLATYFELRILFHILKPKYKLLHLNLFLSVETLKYSGQVVLCLTLNLVSISLYNT